MRTIDACGWAAFAFVLTSLAEARAQEDQTPPAAEAEPICGSPVGCEAPPAGNGAISYPADYFAPFAPQTALEMVERTPGFALNAGDERRGFSGAVGNVLIDGVRPTAKSQTLEAILSRIPANQVIRVELLRGADIAGDASGQALLLNIVRTSSGGSGVWNAGVEYSSRHIPGPRGEISYSGRRAQVEYGVGVAVHSEYRDRPGSGALYDEVNRATTLIRTTSPREFYSARINGNLVFPLFDGTFGLTSQLDRSRFYGDYGYAFSMAPDTLLHGAAAAYEEDRRGFETGLSYERTAGPWSFALTGLLTRRRLSISEDWRYEDGAENPTSTLVLSVAQDSGETILRGSLGRVLGRDQRLEFGAEAAFNTLEQHLGLMGDPQPPAIPNSNALVEEARGEVFGVHTWRLGARWALESRLAWETSTLTFSGDTNQATELAFWKPSAQISRTLGENSQLRLRVSRDVGQLNFGDFVSGAAIADERVAGGNPDLAPQTEWRAELGADVRLAGGAAIGLTLTHHRIDNVADVVQILVPDPPNQDIRLDAPGNIGPGRAWSVDLTASTPIDFIPGARISLDAYWWQTEVNDPVTGLERVFSNRPESRVEMHFRQDLPTRRFAWGVDVIKRSEARLYRFNEIDVIEEGHYVDLFVETTSLPSSARVRLWAADIFGAPEERERSFFAPDRAGPFIGRDARTRGLRGAPWFLLELSGRF